MRPGSRRGCGCVRRARFTLEPTGHVIITEYDAVAAGLVERLNAAAIPYFIVEPDAAKAARFINDELSVVAGDNDSRATYERLRTVTARLVVANCEDTSNTNITLTVREVAPDVHIAAVVEEDDSVDILQLSGATTVLPLKRQLGESLANRVDTGRPEAHAIGAFHGVHVAELPVRDTLLAGALVRDTRLRELTGLSVVGLWERGRLQPAFPHTVPAADSVAVVAGSADQIRVLNAMIASEGTTAPVLVIGAGKVGQAAARALKQKGLVVYVLDRDQHALEILAADVDAVHPGDAADRQTIERAGIGRVASVLLTTNDDAMNIYLAVYCRKLNPDLRIVSRITHERNVEAIHRAGADFALSYTSLGVDSIMSIVNGDATVVLGEGVRLFEVRVPPSLAGQPLSKTNIGSRTGLSVVAIGDEESLTTQLTAETVLPRVGTLLMLGNAAQRHVFAEAFEQAGR